MADIGQPSAGLAGDPQMGVTYDNTAAYPYPLLLRNTTQFQQVDPSGASIANGEGRIPTFSYATIAYSPYATATDILVITGSSVTGIAGIGSILPGASYTAGTYNGVTVTGGSGSSATANVVVAGGGVSSVVITGSNGTGFKIGDLLSVAAASIGGTGSGFSFTVTALGKVVRVKRIAVSGRATAAANIDIGIFKHTVANTSGTPTALTAVKHDTVVNPSATAVVSTYAAAPTIDGTKVLFRAQQSNLSAAGSGGAATPVEWHFGDVNDQAMVLRGITEEVAINLGGGAVPGGTVLNIFIETTEE